MDDVKIRMIAFMELSKRVQLHGSALPWAEIIRTFRIGDEEIYLTNRARGIFKPKQMKRGVLSVKSTLPRTGRHRRYIDDIRDDSLFYSLQGDHPGGHDNERLKEAFEDQTPFVYFSGISEGRYEALWPVYVSRWLPEEHRVEIQIGAAVTQVSASSIVQEEERKYLTNLAKQRIHQAAFREMVLDAYECRCALSDLPVRELLEAAHIFPDGHEKGRATVTNGIAMSNLHHAAYDSNLIGINPDGVIVISDRLFEVSDGPLLELGLKALRGLRIKLPKVAELRPDRDALAFRFEDFLKVG